MGINMSSFGIQLNTLCREDYVVKSEHTAKHLGSGEVEVLSTPSMILFIESTALKCIQQFLSNEYTTVGVRIDIKHLNPAPVNSKVTVETKIVGIEGRKIILETRVFWKTLLIGEGVHERFIVDKRKFLNKVRKLMRELGT